MLNLNARIPRTISTSSLTTASINDDGASIDDSRPILIVEDEYLIGMELARQIIEDGGLVRGPAQSPEDAFRLLAIEEPLAGAIIDVKSSVRSAFGLADTLTERQIPFVFHSGDDRIDWPVRFANIPKIRKPAAWETIKAALSVQRPVSLSDTSSADRSFHQHLRAALPGLRRAARRLTGTSEAADNLLEQTLGHALGDILGHAEHPSVEAWLNALMRQIHRSVSNQTLH